MPNEDAAPAVGRIDFVDNNVDQLTGTIRVKATFPNADRRLWPGQFVNVTVALTDDATAIVVPTPAIQVGQQGQYTFVVKDDHSVEYRAVTVQRTSGLETVIKRRAQAGRNGRHGRPPAPGRRQPGQHQRRRGREGDAMNLSQLFITRPVTTTLLMLGILVFGTMAYRTLPVSDLPTIDFPTIQVSAGLPGASPETMAATVALPLEKQFAAIAGLSNINSVSQMGTTNITLQFDLSRNIDAAAQDVQAMIGRASRALPPQMPAPPSYQKSNPGDQSVILLVLRSATLPLSMIDEYAQQSIAQRLSMLPGVAQIDVFGSQKYAVRIDVDPRELAARSIGIDEVATAVASANSNLPTGTIYGQKTFVVQTNGQLMRAAAFGPSILAYRNGNPVRLEEVAHVYDGVENDKSGAWQKGERCVMISIRRQPGANVVEVVDRIKALLPAIREQLPAAMALDTRNDRSASIRESVHDVKLTLAHHHRAGGAGDLPVPAERVRDADSESRPARLARRHVHGDVPPRLQPRQHVADGPHALGRLRRRRRDRDARKHRAPHGDGQAADAGGAGRIEGNRLHDSRR